MSRFRFEPWDGLPKSQKSPIAKKKPQNKTGPGSEDGSVRPSVVSYLAWKYPKVRVYVAKDSNMQGAGNVFQHTRAGHPDLIVYCHAPLRILYLELKREGVNLRLKRTPERWANDHFSGQAAYLRHLRQCGQAAIFAVGYAEAVAMIDAHMAGEDVNTLSKHPL